MKNKVSRFSRNFSLPELRRKGQKSIRSFTKKELASFLALFLIALITLIWTLGILSSRASIDVPIKGGSLREGIIGTPRFINPVLAVSDSDKDLSAVVYSGLMRLDEMGYPMNDLAESYTITPDGKTYTFTIRDDAYFHDNTKVTADDVVYTINQIQHPLIDSPKKASWQNVIVKKIDEKTISFSLNQPFSPFLELTVVGILPQHIWAELSPEEFAFSDLNINAIGSGPYKIKSIKRNESGIADEFRLVYWKKFNLEKPYITKVSIISFANERDLGDALSSRKIDIASGLSPTKSSALAEKGLEISADTLPRVFGLFINKGNNPIFNDSAVMSAVKNGIDKKEIVDQVLLGYGKIIESPIPDIFLSKDESENEPKQEDYSQILEKAGWVMGADNIRFKTEPKTKSTTNLVFSITTADSPELVATAEIIKKNLEKLGFGIEVKIYGLADLNQDIIRQRNYDTLLFGQYVTGIGSLYSFWHSSQASDPGLNIANYRSNTTDKAFGELFTSNIKEDREKALKTIESDIVKNAPVVFLYSPLYLEAKNNLTINNNLNIGIISPSDRFRNIYSWYLETEKVWKFLIKNNN